MGHKPSKHDKTSKHERQLVTRIKHGYKRALIDRLQEFQLVHKSHVRLRDIFAKPIHISPGYKPPVHSKSEDEKEFLLSSLKESFIFSSMDDDELEMMANAMEALKVSKGTTIITQGDEGDYFYLIEKGTVEFWINGKSVGNGGPGCHFGDLALLYNCPRAATCIAHQDCKLWRIDQENFRKILAVRRFKVEDEKLETMRKVNFMKCLSEDDLRQISDLLTEVHYEEGDLIMEKGQVNAFFIISQGNVLVKDISVNESQYVNALLGPGDCFGDKAVYDEGNFIAKTDCTILRMPKEHFLHMVTPLKSLIQGRKLKYKLMAVPLIAKGNFSDNDIDHLVSLLNPATFGTDQIICREGKVVQPAIYFIQSGKISLEKQGQTRILGPDEYIGDETFLQGKLFESDCTLKSMEETMCQILTLNSVQIVHRSLSKVMLGEKADQLLKPDIKLRNLEKQFILGSGTFADVWLVCDKRKSKSGIYALKIQSKRKIISVCQQENVVAEKNINSKLHHPFIQELINAFQDDCFLYSVMKLYQGGELYKVMDRKNGLPELQAKFYAACILEAMNYMHHRHVIHRDFKPENILFDSDGYCVVCDFGFAKVVLSRTYTLCGTPLYVAPEAILQRGYNKSADVWSFGIIVYEMLIGKTPFYQRGIDQVTLFKKICVGNYKFPKKVNADAMQLISLLLQVRQEDRLGCLAGGDATIRKQAWFQSIDFEQLVNKQLQAPWVPKIKDPLDRSHFDDWSESKQKYDEKPLEDWEQDYFREF